MTQPPGPGPGPRLPTDAALSANANIDARARAYKKAGIAPDARLDQLRVLAFADILNGITLTDRIALAEAEAQAQATAEASAGAGSGTASGPGNDPARKDLEPCAIGGGTGRAPAGSARPPRGTR